MAYLKNLSTLITALELKNLTKLPTFAKQFRIVEAGMGETAKKSFCEEGHITDQAVFIDTMGCAEPTKEIPRNLPESRCFQTYLSNLGISNAHHLIIYDRSQYGFYASSRVWWILRMYGHDKVSILNGGLNSWTKNGFELSKKCCSINKETFQIVNEKKDFKRDFDQIQKNIQTQQEQLLDARGEADFKKDHVPCAQNVPYSELFDANTGLFKTREDLCKLFIGKNVKFTKPFVVMCQTGMTATSLALAAYVLGFRNVPVYYGSWTEYSQRTNVKK